MKKVTFTVLAMALAATGFFAGPAASQQASYSITLGENSFSPSALSVPAGVKIKLVVHNARKVTAEFESYDLNREKIIAPGASAVIYVGPLRPGSYDIFDDFHMSTKGRVVAK